MIAAVHRGPGRPLGSRDRHGRATRPSAHDVASLMRRIGRRVYDARCERDVSADELAAAIGGHVATILRIERGDRAARTSTLARIALALGISLSELLA